MIYPVKVWTRQGLRKLLRPDKQKSLRTLEALVQHQNNYKLSKNERIKFNRMNVDDIDKPIKEKIYKPLENAYAQSNISEHGKLRQYSAYLIKCVGCGAEGERYNKNARYCSDKCYRKYYSKKSYNNQKGERNETGCQAV